MLFVNQVPSFKFQFGPDNYSSYLEMTCINDPDGGSPVWNPPYDAVINPFPPCVILRKYYIKNIYMTSRIFKRIVRS
jgi:hypothetical protein